MAKWRWREAEKIRRADLINSRILFNSIPLSEHLYINGSENYPPQVTPGAFETIKEAWQGLDLVVIDPLIGFFSGNENDNSQAKQFMSVLTSIATQNNQAILVIHHNTKQDQEGNSTTRGASAPLLMQLGNIIQPQIRKKRSRNTSSR